MVMFKSDDTLQHVSGKFGGVFFRQMACSNQIVRPPRRIRKTPSAAQAKVRACFSKCFRFYVWELTHMEWLMWKHYAETHRKTNRKGEPIFLQSTNWFDHFNIPRCMNDLPLLRVPPLD